MATLLEYEITGSHTGANNVAVLTDSIASFLTRRVHTGDIIYNLTDGSSATITNVTATTITGILAGGVQNDWDTGDLYRIWVSEPNKIRHTYTDTRGFPAAATITVCSPLDIAKDTYRDYQKIRLTDADSGLIYFYGKIESGDSAFDSSYGQVINLFARDNTSELLKKVINTNYSTIRRRGRASPGPSGTHDGAANAVSLTDTTKNFTSLGVLVGDSLRNATDVSTTTITSITTTTNPNDTLVGVLAGGTENDWDVGDVYVVEPIGLINLIIGELRYSSSNIDDSNSAKFETSTVLEAAGVLDQNFVGTGKTGLKVIQELANEDPWDATPTGFGYDFYLDTTFSGSTPAPAENYFKRGTRPSGGASANGLTVELNAVDADQKRSMFMDYYFPTATKELVTQVRVEYVDDSETNQSKTIYLLDVSTRVNAPFIIGSVITGGTSGTTAVVEYDGSTFICVSTLTGTKLWTIGETITAGVVTAVVVRSPRQSFEQDIEIVLRGYNITNVSEARKKAAQLLYHGGNTITRGTFKIARLPYFKIGAVYTQVRVGHVIRVKNTNLGLDEDMLVTKITFDEGPGILFSIVEVLRIGRGAGAEKNIFEGFDEKDQIALWSSFVRSNSGSTRVELNTEGLFGYNGTVKTFYLQASDGKAYAGAGSVILDENGIRINAQFLRFYDDAGNQRGYVYGTSGVNPALLVGTEANVDLYLAPTGSGRLVLGPVTQLTVGAAGAANALPATPEGYLQFRLSPNGTLYVIPYYLQA